MKTIRLDSKEVERMLERVNKAIKKIELSKIPTDNQKIRRAELYAEQNHWENQLERAKEYELDRVKKNRGKSIK